MKAIIHPGRARGRVRVPSSKSAGHRAIICAALAEGESRLSNIDISRDMEVTLGGISALGATWRREGADVLITGRGNRPFGSLSEPVNCGESGSTLRFLIPLFALGSHPVTLTGEGRLMQRPQAIYAKLFAQRGLVYEWNGKGIRLQGPLPPGLYQLPGDVSSQFISGLLFALPLLPAPHAPTHGLPTPANIQPFAPSQGGSSPRHATPPPEGFSPNNAMPSVEGFTPNNAMPPAEGFTPNNAMPPAEGFAPQPPAPPPEDSFSRSIAPFPKGHLPPGDSLIRIAPPFESRSYVNLTLQTLAAFGIQATMMDDEIHIPGGRNYRPQNLSVEGDYSQMAFLAVLCALTGEGEMVGLSHDSLQGDRAIVELLSGFGASLAPIPGGWHVARGGLRGIDIDLSDTPDLGPVLMAAALFARGETVIRNAGRLRIKESDRIAAMQAELRKMGGNIRVQGDTIIIRGRDTRQEGGYSGGVTVQGHNDHRVVMALAVAATAMENPVTIEGAQAVSKSYPHFFEDLKRMGVEVTCIEN